MQIWYCEMCARAYNVTDSEFLGIVTNGDLLADIGVPFEQQEGRDGRSETVRPSRRDVGRIASRLRRAQNRNLLGYVDEEVGYVEQEVLLDEWDGDGVLADAGPIPPLTREEVERMQRELGLITEQRMQAEAARESTREGADEETVPTTGEAASEGESDYDWRRLVTPLWYTPTVSEPGPIRDVGLEEADVPVRDATPEDYQEGCNCAVCQQVREDPNAEAE